ncbi:MAG TPA: metal ABC transporter permease [Acidocella sp.]|nr:metal ABC transporter permease [Acidocella sp.]
MLSYDFMRHAFAAAGIVAVLSGFVGYFLVLRGQAFAGHALSHVGFAGATGAVLIGASPLVGMLAVTTIGGVLMGALGEKLAERDIAIGVILTMSLGLGLLFLHFFTAYATQATALLFGDVLGVSLATIYSLLALSLITLVILGTISRPLLFASISPELAEAKGVNLRAYSFIFLGLVGLTTAACAQIVGVLLVFALMVGPAATSQRLTTRVTPGLILAAGIALAEAWSGIALSYATDWPASFWIATLSGSIYLAASALK